MAAHLRRFGAVGSILVLGSMAGAAPFPQGPTPRAAVVEHACDAALRDRLIASQQVWFDAGEFLVGRFDEDVLRELARAGIASHVVDDVGDLLVVARADAELGEGRVLHRSEHQALLAAPPATEPVARAHGRGVRVLRTAMRPCPQPSTGTASLLVGDPRIQALVDQVSSTNVLGTVQSLSAISSRRATTTGATTAQNLIQGWLQGYGLTTTLQTFGAQYSRNVIAEIPGAAHPERIVVLGAHYDSTNPAGASAPAPGADDNASGTGGVLEAARVLAAGGPYENTLRFVLFSAEEFGLVGSSYAAQQSQAQGEQIVAMLNLDMISYKASSDARDVDFATNNTSAALTAQCRQLGATYVPGWASVTGVLTAGTSDHQAYFAQGYPAVFLFEDLTQYSPYIHSANDTHPQSTNDPELARMIVQAVVASAATIAVPTCTPPTNYCVGGVNSLGLAAQMGALGSTSLAANDLTLTAQGCRPIVSGLFFWGIGETQVPLANGYRCIDSSFLRLGVATTNASGFGSLSLDLLDSPNGPLVNVGDVRSVQFWYRDVAGGGAGCNLTDGLRLTFCP
ncbi:MAG: M28 family peptidase [Planctomycetes bacterium]|nr:M28 family peptidase [Planctomycetota bacterium]